MRGEIDRRRLNASPGELAGIGIYSFECDEVEANVFPNQRLLFMFCYRLRLDDILVRGRGHAGLPGRIAQLQPVAAGVEEILFSSREMTFGAVNQLFDGDFLLVKNFAGLDQRLRRDGERVMDARLVI